MSVRRPSQVYIRKQRGSDPLSWAVFIRGRWYPVISGLSREQAQYEKQRIKRQLEEGRPGGRHEL